MDGTDIRYYLVRPNEKKLKIFLDENVVAIGWSLLDISSVSDIDKLQENIEEKYPHYSNKTNAAKSKILNQILRFRGIRSGDRIIVPAPGAVYLAEASGDIFHSKKYANCDLSNQLPVKYLKTHNGEFLKIPRSKLTEGLQRRIVVQGMYVNTLDEFSEELDRIFNDPNSFLQENTYEQKVNEAKEKLADTLLHNIQKGKTCLPSQGRGLEHLVQALLECEGYKAKILSKKEFPKGIDADIYATKADGFLGETKLLVQVKHHEGITSSGAAQQVIKASQDGRYQDCEPMVITSANVDEETQSLAQQGIIYVIEGEQLVELILLHINDLSQEILEQLGLSKIPQILDI